MLKHAYAVLLDVFQIKTFNPATNEVISADEVLLIGYVEGM